MHWHEVQQSSEAIWEEWAVVSTTEEGKVQGLSLFSFVQNPVEVEGEFPCDGDVFLGKPKFPVCPVTD